MSATLQKRNATCTRIWTPRIRSSSRCVTVDGKRVQVDRDEQESYESAMAASRRAISAPHGRAFAFMARYPQSAYAEFGLSWRELVLRIKDYR